MSLAPRNPAFKVPDDPNTKIWRYVNFTKFVSMLQYSSLFFARSTELGDPFEGSRVRVNEAFRLLQYGQLSLPVEAIGQLFRSEAIVWRLPITHKGIDRSAKPNDTGVLVPVDLSQLVDNVFVSPSAPEWFRALAGDVLRRYSLDVEVRQSSLDDEPFY